MRIMSVNQNIQQKKPAFGTLCHSQIFPVIGNYNIKELQDYKKAAKQLDQISDQYDFNVYLKRTSGQGVSVEYKPKSGVRIKENGKAFTYQDFKADFADIMEDAAIGIARAAKRIASSVKSDPYQKLESSNGGNN